MVKQLLKSPAWKYRVKTAEETAADNLKKSLIVISIICIAMGMFLWYVLRGTHPNIAIGMLVFYLFLSSALAFYAFSKRLTT